MRLERYPLEANDDLMSFQFVSEGPKGQIIKWVQFLKTDKPNFYNLAFGDKRLNEDDFDDDVITDNKDSQKVLATVAMAVLRFTEINKEALIIAQGLTKSRNRLYQMGISQNLEELKEYFKIIGFYKGNWMIYEKNTPYDAFAVKRK